MSAEVLYPYIKTALEKKAEQIHFDQIGNSDQFTLRYRPDYKNFGTVSQNNFSEVLTTLQEIANDKAHISLSDELESVDPVILETVSGYTTALNLIPKVPERGEMSVLSYLQSFGYTERQANDLEAICNSENGLILFSGEIISAKKTFAILRNCRRENSSGSELLFMNNLREDFTTLAKNNVIFSYMPCVSAFNVPFLMQHYAHCVNQSPSYAIIRGLIFQKEAPVLCDTCKVPFEKKSGIRDDLKTTLQKLSAKNREAQLSFAGNGCENCAHTGIEGRTNIAEVVPFLPSYISVYENEKTATRVVDMFAANGGELFQTNALKAVLCGKISPYTYELMCGQFPTYEE